MRIHTIGFSGKSAEQFFAALSQAGVQKLLDIRRSNNTLYSGFTRHRDLPFFLRQLCRITYVHEPAFAPSTALLRAYQARVKASKKDPDAWPEFATGVLSEIRERPILELFRNHSEGLSAVCFLCSEKTPEHCHRRLLAEYIMDESPGESIEVVHL